MSYPKECNHLQKWIFSEEQLKNIRQEVHDAAAERIRYYKTKKPITLITVEEHCFVVEYMAQQLLGLCQHKGIRPVIKESAATFFRRFFLKRSIMEYDPRLIIFTCIILAIKAEDFGRRHQVVDLFGDMQEINTKEVLRLELPLCDAVDFQLLVLHTREPLLGLRAACVQKLKDLLKPNSEREKDLNQLVAQDVYARAEGLAMAVQQTDIPFMYTPSEIAASAFLYYAKISLQSMLNVEQFICNLFEEGDSKITHDLIINKCNEIQEVLNKFRHKKRNENQEEQASKVGSILITAERIWSKVASQTSAPNICSAGDVSGNSSVVANKEEKKKKTKSEKRKRDGDERYDKPAKKKKKDRGDASSSVVSGAGDEEDSSSVIN